MQFKLSRETAVAWIESTVEEIKNLLMLRRIPYEDSWTKEDNMLHGMYHAHQLTFPWSDGDVVIGTLHISDDAVMDGLIPLRYPSIETYRFPWDDDDITVFNSPEEFVLKLDDLYIKTVIEKTND